MPVRWNGTPLKVNGKGARDLSCCCGPNVCCPNLPDELTAQITNDCGTATATLTRGTYLGMTAWTGVVHLDCRTDAFTPCGTTYDIDVRLFYNPSIGVCVINVECLGDEETYIAANYECEPLYMIQELFLTNCGLCRINPTSDITLEILE